MIRIRTTLDSNNRVLTLYFNGWITLVKINGSHKNIEGASFLEAGINHLQACKEMKENFYV